MRNRIIIVVLGLSLGLGARFGVDFYRKSQASSKTAPPAAGEKAPTAAREPKGK